MKPLIFIFILALLAGCASREEKKPEKNAETQTVSEDVDADLPCGCGAPVEW